MDVARQKRIKRNWPGVFAEFHRSGLSIKEFCRVQGHDFKNWLDKIPFEQALPQSPIRQAINYALNGWEALCRYTQDGDFSIDNNVAEQLMRPVAIGRKNWLFFGSDHGGRTAAILFTITQSAQRHSINVFTYLKDIIARISNHPANQLHQLLPDKWTPS